MKILKRPDNIVFDTENPASVQSGGQHFPETPLHHVHEETDFQFLINRFGQQHQILKNFRRSYYYCLEPESTTS